jgi:N-acetylmuramoyl-L-alanine amidase
VIVLDPGHGGADAGARGTQISEADVVLDFSRAIRVALEAKGFTAVLTRGNPGEANQNPSFDDRSAVANARMDDVFVSLHIASTGTPGTARAYFDSLPPIETELQTTSASTSSTAASRNTSLVPWDRAQEPYLNASRRFAELLQIQLAQKFQGSPESPSTAAVRQLRTVAAPAIAVEISNISYDSAKLAQMSQPLGDALARAATDFQQALNDGSVSWGPAR